MTIEEQMYDEIMHKMPHRIAELVKTIDTIHKMLEAKHLGALSDNLDQLKKTLAQTEQKYNDLYESFYQTGNFHDILLPKSYSEIEDSFVNSGYIEDRINEQADYYRNEDGEVDVSKLDYGPYDEHEAGQFDLYDNFLEVSQNDDFKDFCKYYYKDGYDIEESGTFEDNYIDGNGNFDFEKFCEETDFKHDMMQPISGSILLGDKVREALEQAKEAWAEPGKEEEWEQAYVNEDFEALLPDTTEAIKDWLKNDVIDYPNTCIGGMQGMLNYNDRITNRNQLTTYNDYDLISFRDNEFKECKWLDGFEQSEEFKTLCEYYYNEEYDTKESGTFKDNYIKGNGDFDFYKFESETNFTQDIADPYFKQMINDPDINEKIEQTNEEIYNAFDERMKAQSQEQDIDTFINSHDDLKVNILYTNGDGNHINEINCISSDGRYTLDVSKMNLASDTSMEKLQQIAKNIIASTKAKGPIIKPEPIKQNNDFER